MLPRKEKAISEVKPSRRKDSAPLFFLLPVFICLVIQTGWMLSVVKRRFPFFRSQSYSPSLSPLRLEEYSVNLWGLILCDHLGMSAHMPRA